jgi:SAM-dependent methyltransferase
MRTNEVAYWNVQMMKRWRKGPALLAARDLEAFWDGRTNAVEQEASDPSFLDYAAALVGCIQAKARPLPTDTGLELGVGTGSLALPLARRLSSVTVCDASEQMLQRVSAEARQEGLAPIGAVHRRWMDVMPYRDIGAHDIVIAHRSLELIACDRSGSPNFVDCIAKMDQLTRRAAFIIPQAFSLPDDGEFRALFPECMGGPPVRFSDLTTLNLLSAMGLCPRLEYVSIRKTHQFRSIDEEVAAFRHFFRLDGVRRLKRLGEYLAKSATRQSHGYSLRTVTKAMVMWWPKEP